MRGSFCMVKKFVFLFGLVLLLSLVSVGANSVCRQDLPNESGGCGDGGGSIDVVGAEDGAFFGKVMFNYVKPVGATNSSLWQVNYGWDNVSSAPFLYNVSIPSSCWVYSPNVVLRMWSKYYGYGGGVGAVASGLQCFDGGWVDFGVVSDLNLSSYLGGFNMGGGNEVYVYDKVYSVGNSFSGAYFCVDSPTVYWMRTLNPLSVSRASILYEQSMFWDIGCVEDWVRVDVGVCDGLISSYMITYADQNVCGTTSNLPVDNGTLVFCCVEDWSGGFGSCRNGVHTLSYVDLGVCNTSYQLPVDNGSVSGCVEPSSGGGSVSQVVVVVRNETKGSGLVSQDALSGVGADTSGLASLWNRFILWLMFWK
jgi:hypothetical protein